MCFRFQGLTSTNRGRPARELVTFDMFSMFEQDFAFAISLLPVETVYTFAETTDESLPDGIAPCGHHRPAGGLSDLQQRR